MKKIMLFLLFCFVFIHINAQKNWNKYAALFGEQSAHLAEADSNVVRVFIDKNGFYYPDLYIKDRKLRRKDSSIKNYLSNNLGAFHQVADSFNIPVELSLDDKIDALNDSIIQTKIALINEKMKAYNTAVILVHGFRKRVYGKVSSTYSIQDNKTLQSRLAKPGNKTLFIEIYWDGTYISPFRSYKYRGLKLMEQSAIPHAEQVGLALRKLIPYIKTDTISMLSHSLGAIVVANLLFNVSPQELPTPSQNQVNICLIAPAIGHSLFANYYQRNSTIDFTKKDNYRLAVVYNENDFALHKTFKIGLLKLDVPPTAFGDTSLGCNCDGDLNKLVDLFKENFKASPIPLLIHMDASRNGQKMLCHGIRCYAGHYKMEEVVSFFK